MLQRYALSLDIWAYHTQLSEVLDLAREHPGTTIVLDHLGGPIGIGPYAGRRQEVFGAWKASLTRLAQLSNVYLKLGGLGMRVGGFAFHEQLVPPSSEELCAAWRPYVETAIELFGVERCMFESNFPVDKGMFSYAVLWNAFKRLAAACSAPERQALFFDTAASTYRLDEALLQAPEA
jgi:predicted TIM-barrel fold metal-dependent hydrolase